MTLVINQTAQTSFTKKKKTMSTREKNDFFLQYKALRNTLIHFVCYNIIQHNSLVNHIMWWNVCQHTTLRVWLRSSMFKKSCLRNVPKTMDSILLFLIEIHVEFKIMSPYLLCVALVCLFIFIFLIKLFRMNKFLFYL